MTLESNFVSCRPSIADQVRIGYFSQDRSSQTEVSEIAQLKEMTEVLQNLVRVSANHQTFQRIG